MKLKKKDAEIFFTMDGLGNVLSLKIINSATYQDYTYCRTRSKTSWASQWLPASAGKKAVFRDKGYTQPFHILGPSVHHI